MINDFLIIARLQLLSMWQEPRVPWRYR